MELGGVWFRAEEDLRSGGSKNFIALSSKVLDLHFVCSSAFGAIEASSSLEVSEIEGQSQGLDSAHVSFFLGIVAEMITSCS